MEASPPRSFWCFISYRHSDNKDIGRQWATWLHQQIETYEVPVELVGTVNGRGDKIPERIFPVFRDEDELPADADLSSPIYRALDASKFLVVLCSPRAVQSVYVAAEIAYYKKIGRSDRILAALLEGEPNASWDAGKQAAGIPATAECFPRPLRHPVDAAGEMVESEHAEPIAADFRLNDGSQGWTSPEAYRQVLLEEGKIPKKEIDARVADYRRSLDLAKLKIIAGILGVSLGTLTQRDKAYQLEKARKRAAIFRRVAIAMGVLTVGAVAAGGIALVQKQEAERQRKAASAARDAEAEQRGVAEKRRGEAEEARGLAENRRTEAETARNLAETRRVESEKRLARSNAQLSERLSREGDTDNAAQALWDIPENGRGWEWGYLLGRAYPEAARISLFEKQNGMPKDGLIDPSGTRTLAWSSQPRDPETFQPTPGEIRHVALDSSGVAAAKTLPVKGALGAMAWSRDGHCLIGDGSEVRVYSPAGDLVAETTLPAPVTSGGFISPDGSRFAICCGDGGDDLWSILRVEGGAIRMVGQMTGEFELSKFGAASADGSRWVIMTDADGISIYDAEGQFIETIKGLWGPEVAFADDGSLAIATIDQQVLVKKPGKNAKPLKLHDTVETIRRNTTGVTVSWVGTHLFVRHIRDLWRWNLAVAEPENAGGYAQLTGEEWSLTMAASSSWIAVGMSQGTIVVFDAESMDEADRLKGHAGAISTLRFAGKDLLASTAEDGSLRYWPLKKSIRFDSIVDDEELPADAFYQLENVEKAPEASVPDAPASPGKPYGTRVRVLSPSGDRAATGGRDSKVRLWEPTTHDLLLTFQAPGTFVETLGYSKDGMRLGGTFITPGEDQTSECVWEAQPWTREQLGIAADADWRAAWETKRKEAFSRIWQAR